MTQPATIRLSITKEVSEALSIAKKIYPTLSDPEILKLGLSIIITDNSYSSKYTNIQNQIRLEAAHAVGIDYLNDTEEDIYTSENGKKVSF